MSADQLAVIAIMFAGLGILLGFTAICAAISNRYAPTIDRVFVLEVTKTVDAPRPPSDFQITVNSPDSDTASIAHEITRHMKRGATC